MSGQQKPIALDQSLQYQIEVQGRLDPKWSAFFDGLAISTEKAGDGPAITTLLGIIADQAALHGVLNAIRDLGLPLLLVRMVCSPPVAAKI